MTKLSSNLRRSGNALTVLLTLLAVALLASGCATSGSAAAAAPAGPSDEEQIQTILNSALSALESGDIASLMSNYSEDFTWDQGDRASMEAFMTQAKDAGFLDGFSSDMSGLTINVDGDSATATGASVEGAFGLLDLSFTLAKRAGSWIITQQSQQ